MKERSASRRRAEKGLLAHLPGDHRLFHADTAEDCSQLVGGLWAGGLGVLLLLLLLLLVPPGAACTAYAARVKRRRL
jgi:hypothetical protein